MIRGFGLRVLMLLPAFLFLAGCGIATIQDDVRRLPSSMNDLRAVQAEQTT